MTNLFDALEFCLQEMERGEDLESVLARFPEHAGELRPILKTSMQARAMASPEPSPDVMRRSRTRVMKRAAEMRESKFAPRKRAIPLFQRLAISFTLTALLLMSSSGLLSASASALPGENLYPVKRGWENIRLFFIFDSEARKLLEDEFENERLHEANELLTEGRHEVIEFAGVFMQVNGVSYISGLQVILPVGMPLPANGDAVVVSGRTNAQGFVEVISLDLLPAGSVVPAGKPIEMEIESDSEGETIPPAESSSGSGNEPPQSAPAEFEVKGTLEVVSTTSLVINGMTVYLDNNSRVKDQLCIGMEVEVKGYYDADGKFVVREAKGKGKCSGESSDSAPSSTNFDSNSNEDDNSEDDDAIDNSHDDSDDNDSNDDSHDDSNDSDSNDSNSNDDHSGESSDD